MPKGTVKLHRILKTTAEKLYRAFTEADAVAAWYPPYGFLCEIHLFDAREQGKFEMSFKNFTTGEAHRFGGSFTEIVPNKFIKYTDQFEDNSLPGIITTSVWMDNNSAGVALKIVQEGLPEAIPVELCYLGWQDSLDKLQKLVERNID